MPPRCYQHPGARSHLHVRCNVHDRTYAPDVESTGFARAGLPDDPDLEMEVATRGPVGRLDAVCQGCGTATVCEARQVGLEPTADPLKSAGNPHVFQATGGHTGGTQVKTAEMDPPFIKLRGK